MAAGGANLCVADWTGDGRFDLLVNSTSADVLEQILQRDGNWYFKSTGPLAKQSIEGHDVSPSVVDFDGDGTLDFVGGAEDGRFYFLANPRSKN